MSLQQLHFRRDALDAALTIALLRSHLDSGGAPWISLEPRAWLPERNGQHISGRLPGLAPLARTLPDGLDDLPLLAASLYHTDSWIHFHAAHPLSHTPGNVFSWHTQPFEGSRPIEDLQCQRQSVLSWQDRDRFGLPPDQALPESLKVERYYQRGKLIAWRLIPTCTEACA